MKEDNVMGVTAPVYLTEHLKVFLFVLKPAI